MRPWRRTNDPVQRRRRGALGLSWLLVAGACAEGDDAVVVTIDLRPAVQDDRINALELTLGNAGEQLTQTFSAAGVTYPATFSISHPGRVGALTVEVRAVDVEAVEVARGVSTFDLDSTAPSVRLEPGDYLVNSTETGDQELAVTAANTGQQLAATGDRIAIAYRDACTTEACVVRGRVFDQRTRPVATELAAGTGAFAWPTLPFQADPGSEVVLTTLSDGAAVAVWRGATQLRCRAVAADGATRSDTIMLVGAAAAESITAQTLGNDDVLLTWVEPIDTQTSQFMTMVVDAACRSVRVAAPAGPAVMTRPIAVVTPTSSLFVFYTGSALEALRGDASGAPDPTNRVQLLYQAPVMESIQQWRMEATARGYALLVGTAQRTSTSGPLRLVRFDADLAPVGLPTELGVGQHGKTFPPDMAIRADGALAITWLSQAEPVTGLALQIVRPTGLPVGRPIPVPTTEAGSGAIQPQVAALADAFVVAWTAPAGDADGKGVRARVLYPPFEDAAQIVGAACDLDGPRGCDEATACVADADRVPRCHPRCDPNTTGVACPGGGACVDVSGTSVCLLEP